MASSTTSHVLSEYKRSWLAANASSFSFKFNGDTVIETNLGDLCMWWPKMGSLNILAAPLNSGSQRMEVAIPGEKLQRCSR